MQVPAKIIKSFILLFILNFFISSAYADNLEDAITAYKSEDYKRALTILRTEAENDPNNPEIYRWIAKTYESMFDIEKSLEAYKKYESLKRNQELSVKPSLNPTSLPTVRPSIAVRPTPRPTVIPTPKPTLEPKYAGWSNIKISEYKIKKDIKLIPKNSVDMSEIVEKPVNDKKFFLVECKIKYDKNIIIKSNSEQITVTDQENNLYPLYAMSTYKFNYGGNKASQKVEVILVSDYYELSKKDSRNNVQFVFKVDNDAKIKSMFVKGYGNLAIK